MRPPVAGPSEFLGEIDVWRKHQRQTREIEPGVDSLSLPPHLFFIAMSSRQGGKLKPLKAPKKEKKDETEDEIAFKEKKKAEAEAMKAARERAMKGGPMVGGGIKKSGKK
ncbi:Translation machinery-associated protein 7 [Hypsizygus marmoreus]|uniref:Translation machinery-associated protein 7 n=1 Tax=Hypsizygus marmoreus TaxID=39966 RepID=A0A369JQH2_HYPMA|nr:Translation machinery-associated protein 7 [Hypsizygus marmoreus]